MDVLAVLDEFEVDGDLKGNEFRTLCPFHNDTNPSCSINVEKGVFRCLSCDAKGDIYGFLAAITSSSKAAVKKLVGEGDAKPSTLSVNLATNWHKQLLNSPKLLAKLRKKGINKNTIEKFLLGSDGARVTIPIFNTKGEVVNVRKWLPDATKRKIINMKGYGATALYPIDSLKSDTIIVTEGELKALLLCQMGYKALASTSGSKTWEDAWGGFFKDKKVYIIFDIDTPGKKGAQNVAKSLYRHTPELFIVDLPLNPIEYPSGDITDFVVNLKHSKNDINKLLKSAYRWEPLVYRETFDDKPQEVHLSQSTDARYFNCVIQTKVVISAKDTAPFMVPYHVKVKCPKDQDICAFCSIIRNKSDEFKIDKKHPVLLELINVSSERQRVAIKRAVGIPKPCTGCFFEVKESMNIEEIRLIPQIHISHANTENVVRQGFYVGHGLETNANYIIKARVCPQPQTQYATLIIFEAEPVVDNLTTFQLKENLSIFQPDEWTKESISEKLRALYLDFESNITRIYQRYNLHLFYDLCYHSVLYIPFQNQVIKGWVEGLVLGDSGQGKSETIIQLQKHYKVGERIDVKSSTSVGLIGGLQETAKRWFITWGIIPLNDRRLVVLEEVKGLPQEVIAKLTETRSSGIAEISKVEKARTNARVRLIWISNPRTDRQVLSYNYGVEAIRELIGNLEDIRRFDFAIVVTVNDVDKKWINLSLDKRPKIKHKHTSKLCQQLIMWGWSRQYSDIVIEEDATQEILRVASKMSDTYSSQIPLVETADQRLKITRLAAALAVRTFSTENNKTLIVRKCHVEFIDDFLNTVYSSRACGYLDYSKLVKREIEVKNQDDIKERLRTMPYAQSIVETFLDTKIFSVFDLIDWTEMEPDVCRALIGLLVRNNAIKRYKRGYVKTTAFIALLKELQMEGLGNETRYDKAVAEEF